MDMMDVVLTAFSHVTKEECKNWINHALWNLCFFQNNICETYIRRGFN